MKIDLNNRKHCNRIVDVSAVLIVALILIYSWNDLF